MLIYFLTCWLMLNMSKLGRDSKTSPRKSPKRNLSRTPPQKNRWNNQKKIQNRWWLSHHSESNQCSMAPRYSCPPPSHLPNSHGQRFDSWHGWHSWHFQCLRRCFLAGYWTCLNLFILCTITNLYHDKSLYTLYFMWILYLQKYIFFLKITNYYRIAWHVPHLLLVPSPSIPLGWNFHRWFSLPFYSRLEDDR